MFKKEGVIYSEVAANRIEEDYRDLTIGTGKPGIFGHPGKSNFKRGLEGRKRK